MFDRRTFVTALAATGACTFAGVPIASAAEHRKHRIRTTDDTELYIKDSGGRGRPVILTHAWPLSAEIWEPQFTALARAGFRAIAYDRRGFGRSSKPRRGYDFDTFADDLAGVIEQLNLREVSIVGYSMGGGEVVRYFSRHGGKHAIKAGFVGAAASLLTKTPDNPNGVDASVFAGIKAGVRQDRRTYLAGLLKDVFFDAARPATVPVTEAMLAGWLDVAMQADLEATLQCVDAFGSTDFRSELPTVKVPALVLHGTADIPVPIALGRATARGLQQATLIEYANVSHGLVITEAERVNRDLIAFLSA